MMKRWLSLMLCAVLALGLLWAGTGLAEEGYRYFERSTPEENGISSEYILDMLDFIQEKGIEVHSLMLAVGDKVIYEAEFAPYHREDLHVLNSLSKLLTVTATGLLVDQGVLSLDDYVLDFFPESVPENVDPMLKSLQVKHLVSMTFGHAAPVESQSAGEDSWVEYILGVPLQTAPGTKFLYDGSATQLMSAIITKVTGKTNEEVLRDTGFLEALDIQDIYWSVTKDGFSNGAGGARMRVEDLLKLGILYMNGGLWNGQRVLSEDWCNKALGYDIVVEYEGYTGYAFHWTNKDCGYIHATGAYGQHILIDPELNLTVAFVGAIKAIPQDIPVKYLIKPTLKDGADRHYDGARYQELLARTEALTLMYDAEATTSPLEAVVGGRTYAAGGDDLTGLRLDFDDDAVTLTLCNEAGETTIAAGKSQWTSGAADMSAVRLHGGCMDQENITANAQWVDDATLQMTVFFTNMPYRDTLTLTFADDGASVRLDKETNIGDDPHSFAFSLSDAPEAVETDAAEAQDEAETAEGLELTTGEFVVGRDIPAGAYRLRNTAQATILTLYADEADEAGEEQYLYGDETVELTLADGQRLTLDGAGTLSEIE